MVTIGIPTCFKETTIYETINSALNQTYKNIEVLIADDSGDPTNERITKVKETYKDKIRVMHHKENLGIGAARKTLVNEAKGEYIYFISADDALCENAVEEMVKASSKHPDSILYSDYFIMDGEGRVGQIFKTSYFTDIVDMKIASAEAAKRTTMFICYNIFAPTQLLRKHNFDEQWRFGEDLEHVLRCLLVENIKFVHVPQPLFKYRIHSKSMTSQKINQIAENNKKIFKKINQLAGKKIFDV